MHEPDPIEADLNDLDRFPPSMARRHRRHTTQGIVCGQRLLVRADAPVLAEDVD